MFSRVYLPRRPHLPHDDMDYRKCEACAYSTLRMRTLAGRLGNLLIDVGRALGGEVMLGNRSRRIS